ncbi:MAG: hypothetical protein ACREC8_12050 [Limisphaerales bacterium]
MKTIKQLRIILASLFVCGIAGVALKVLADPPQPVISITSLGTNVFSISITNGVGTANYDLYWTPLLGNPDYPWTAAAIGNTGQTNFVLDMEDYDSAFFRVILEDTNSIPLWKLADPNNPSLGVLAVTIDSPTNNSVLQ